MSLAVPKCRPFQVEVIAGVWIAAVHIELDEQFKLSVIESPDVDGQMPYYRDRRSAEQATDRLAQEFGRFLRGAESCIELRVCWSERCY